MQSTATISGITQHDRYDTTAILPLQIQSCFHGILSKIKIDAIIRDIDQVCDAEKRTQEIMRIVSSATNLDVNHPFFQSKDLTHTEVTKATSAVDRFLRIVASIGKVSENAQVVSYNDLTYFGSNTKGIESAWGYLVSFAINYVNDFYQYGNSDTSSLFISECTIENINQCFVTRKELFHKAFYDIESKLAFTLNQKDKERIIREISADLSVNSSEQIQAKEIQKRVQVKVQEHYDQILTKSKDFPNAINSSLIISCNEVGLKAPNIASVSRVNEYLNQGGSIFLFCCPDYARTRLESGQYRYDMNGVNGGIGLTAERALPTLSKIIASISSAPVRNRPLNIRIGIADFEATLENATSVGLTSIQEFDTKLGTSVVAIFNELQRSMPANTKANRIEMGGSATIPEIKVEQTFLDGSPFASITIGRVTRALGADDFTTRVATARSLLKERVQSDENFRKKVDSVLIKRLDLMLRWASPDEPSIIQELRDTTKFPDKEAVINFLNSEDPTPQTALLYLRQKVASQGAEYFVMHDLIAQNNYPIHLIADSSVMWQTFGNESIPLLTVSGMYEGS